MAIEIVDLPIKNGDFPVRYVSYQRVMLHFSMDFLMVFPFSHGFSHGLRGGGDFFRNTERRGAVLESRTHRLSGRMNSFCSMAPEVSWKPGDVLDSVSSSIWILMIIMVNR